MNLVINAAEAIGNEQGTVEVSTFLRPIGPSELETNVTRQPIPPGKYVAMVVRDTGAGMDEQTRARIFDPFFTTKFAGRGLGLSAVLGIIRGHGGALLLESHPGKGTTFRVKAGSSVISLYIDGVLKTPTSQPYTATNTNAFGNNPFYLFSRGGTQEYSAGIVDDLRLYNQALSASQIQQIYEAGVATLVSIAVTPANPSIAKGGDAAVHGDRDLQRRKHAEPDAARRRGVREHHGGDDQRGGPGDARWARDVRPFRRRSGASAGSTTLTVTAATLVSIAVTPANPSIAKGGDAAVHGDGHLQRRHTQNLTRTATWSSSSATMATINAAGLATRWARDVDHQATLGSVDRLDDADGDGGDAGVDRGDAGEPVDRQGRHAAVHGDGDLQRRHTQNLTSTATWSSSGNQRGDDQQRRAWRRRRGRDDDDQATSGAVSGSTTLTVTAATLVSIAVTPANPSIAKGGRSSSRRREPTATAARRT